MFTFLNLAGIALAVVLSPIAPDAPAHQPQMAVNRSVVALTFGAGKGIYYTASADSGKTFSEPVKVSEGEIVPLTRHRGPRIVFSGSTIVISAVVGRTLMRRAACPRFAFGRRLNRVALYRRWPEMDQRSPDQRRPWCSDRRPAFPCGRRERQSFCRVA